MKSRLVVTGLVAAIAVASLVGRSYLRRNAPGDRPPRGGNYRRIVSMAPSVTETLFALGLGDRIVGVTSFCVYPPVARSLEDIGGFLDPNYEAIIGLEPDLVVMIADHRKAEARLTDLGLPVLVVEQRETQSIVQSIITLGRSCGAEAAAWDLVADIGARIAKVRRRTAGRGTARVLVCIGRPIGEPISGTVFVAGRRTFYDEIVHLAGGENAYADDTVSYPEIAIEGLLHLDPDVILDIVPEIDSKGLTEEDLKGDWAVLGDLGAVRSGRIHALSADYVSVPGPRFVNLLEEVAAILHPSPDDPESTEDGS